MADGPHFVWRGYIFVWGVGLEAQLPSPCLATSLIILKGAILLMGHFSVATGGG